MAGEDIYRFLSHGAFYYIDNYGNVYHHDGTLACATSSHTDPDGHTAFSFNIGQLLYVFGTDGLWCFDAAGNFNPVLLDLSDRLSAAPLGKKGRRDDDQSPGPNGLVKLGSANYNRKTNPMPRKNKHFFCASNRLYYFDDQKRLYSHDGKHIGGGLPSAKTDEACILSVQIDGVPYWFEEGVLLTRGANGTPDRVHTWSNKPNPVNQPQLTHTLLGIPGMMSSPALSASQSPSNPITIDLPKVEEPSLFAETEPRNTASIPTVPSQPTTNETPGAPPNAQPVKKCGGKNNKTCPHCGKVLRRPVALQVHINAHTGAKPFVCPFEGCNVGFAVRQNMRRHFDIHRAGKIEEYVPPARDTKRQRVEEPTAPENQEGSQIGQSQPTDDSGNNNTGANLHACPFLGCDIKCIIRPHLEGHFGTHNIGKLEDYEAGVTSQLNLIDLQNTEEAAVLDNQEAPKSGQFFPSGGSTYGGTVAPRLPWSAWTNLFDGIEQGTAEAPFIPDDLNTYPDSLNIGKIEDYEPPEKDAKQRRIEKPTVPNLEVTGLEEAVVLSLPEDHDAYLAELAEFFTQV